MEFDDNGIDLTGVCSGSTLLQWEAFIEAFRASNEGRLPFGLGAMQNFDVSTCLNKLVEYRFLKECSKHPGHYMLSGDSYHRLSSLRVIDQDLAN